MMKRVIAFVVLLGVAFVAGGLAWRFHERHQEEKEFALYGNVDLRQIELPFNSSERIEAVLVQEGERVRRGQVVARLETVRLKLQIAQAEAQVAAGEHVLERLRNGSRPQEIAQAKANVEAADAEVARAQQQYDRLQTLSEKSSGRAVSQLDMDNATALLDVAKAKRQAAQKLLDLVVAGPRQEDIDEAAAKLRAGEAQLALLRQYLQDADLVAPADAVVRTRIMEPGEMAMPQRPVLSLAVINPKWVRTYVSETDLGQVHPGMTMSVEVDSFPDRRFEAWVGFISPVAEFTPKTVQTRDLRTSLVYEVRVFVKDPHDELRLGMPATLHVRNATVGNGVTGTQPASVPATATATERPS